MSLQVNYNDPELWQHLGLIINQFEKLALESGTRDGILATAHGPLAAAELVLKGSNSVLGHKQWGSTKTKGPTTTVTSTETGFIKTSVSEASSTTPGVDTAEDGSDRASVSATGTYEYGMERPEVKETDVIKARSPVPSASVGFDISADADLLAIFPDGSAGDKITEALSSCMGCDTKLKFKWQLQPIDLLGPIGELLDSINASLDQLSANMDPFAPWQNFCEMGNEFKWWCLPDLMMMMMSIKALLRKYLSFQLEIKLDWTVVLGPILKIITELIGTMVAAIVGVMVAPIDCAMAAVGTIAQLEKEIKATASAAAMIGQSVNGILGEDGKPRTEATFAFDSAGPKLQNPTKTQSATRPPAPPKQVGAGINLSTVKPLPKAMKDKDFWDSHWSNKVLSALQDSKEWVQGLDKKLKLALRALNKLVGGGLSISIGNIGLLLMIKDLIGLISALIAMIHQSGLGNKLDFCQVVQDNPEILRSHMERTAGRAAHGVILKPETADTISQVAIYRGPDRVGSIATCINTRNGTPQADLVKQWIAELNGNVR